MSASGATDFLGAGMVGSIKESRKARKAQERAIEIEGRIRERQSQAENIKQLREARIQQARIQQGGENQGVAQSSAVQAGQGIPMTQAGSNINFMAQIQDLQQQIQQQNIIATRSTNKAQMYGQITSTAMTASGALG